MKTMAVDFGGRRIKLGLICDGIVLVQKIIPATADSAQPTMRSMVVYVDRTLQARTPLIAGGVPATVNAALISPYVVNVIPQTIFTH